MNMDFKSAKELLDLCEENQLPISEVMRQRECILGEVPRDAVDHRMATAFDYDKDAKTTRLFFQTVQNKMHYAVHRHTAAELIVERADANKEHMGLTTWENAPDGKILKADVTVAKNYLSKEEMNYLERIVSLYLDYAELQAERKIPMSMEDWAKRLDGFLEFNGNELLTGPGKISAEQAKLHAETEYEKYRVIQDRLYESDFDRFLMLEQEVNHKDEV